jgi:hypothetical protein
MKKITGWLQTVPSEILVAALALWFLSTGCAHHTSQRTAVSPAPGAAPENSGGISDMEIRDVVERVTRHQLQPLADGGYLAVTNLAEAAAAKPPTGIAWNYPQGVMLYGLECFSDASGDKNAGQFVVEHNLICARYYHLLAGLDSQFDGDGRQFVRRTPMKLLMELGTLDELAGKSL